MTDVIISKSLLTEQKQDCKEFDFEVRTTLYPPFVDIADLNEIGQIIRKDETWVLQQFRNAKNMLSPKANEVKPYDDDKLKILTDIAKKYCDAVVLRYV